MKTLVLRAIVLTGICLFGGRLPAQTDDVHWEDFNLTQKIIATKQNKQGTQRQNWGLSVQGQTGGMFIQPHDGYLLGGAVPDLVKNYFGQHPEKMLQWTEALQGVWGVEPADIQPSAGNAWWNGAGVSLEMPPCLALHIRGGATRPTEVSAATQVRVSPFETPTDFVIIGLPTSYTVKQVTLAAGLEARPGSLRVQGLVGGGYHFSKIITGQHFRISYDQLSEQVLFGPEAKAHGGYAETGMRAYLYRGLFLQPVFTTVFMKYAGDPAWLNDEDRAMEVQLSARIGIGYHFRKEK